MDRHRDSARLLLSARRDPSQPVRVLPEAMAPKTEEQAYLVQRVVAEELGGIGGWKVGAAGPDGPCNCAPLPATGVLTGPAEIAERECPMRGVEAEIALRLGRDLPPREAPYGRHEVLDAIASAHPAIEVLQSRFADPDAVDKLSLLADSLSHFALVLGPEVPDWRNVAWDVEEVLVQVNGAEIKRRTANPAGDMIRLVVWLADAGARWAGGLRAGQVVTTGSWTGKDFVPSGADVRVAFPHAGEAVLRFVP